MAPPCKNDFSKVVDDMISDGVAGFGNKKFVKVKATTSVMGSKLRTTVAAEEKKGSFVGKVKFDKFSYEGITLDTLALDANKGLGKLECTLDKLPVPATVACTYDQTNEDTASTVTATYETDTLIATLGVEAKNLSYKSADVGATMAYDGIQVGAALSFEDSYKDAWVGIGYSTKEYFASISAAEGFGEFNVNALAKPTAELAVGCHLTTDMKEKKEMAATCSYKVMSDLSVKAKYSSGGETKGKPDPTQLNLLADYGILPKVQMVGTAVIPLEGGKNSFGLGLTLG